MSSPFTPPCSTRPVRRRDVPRTLRGSRAHGAPDSGRTGRFRAGVVGQRRSVVCACAAVQASPRRGPPRRGRTRHRCRHSSCGALSREESASSADVPPTLRPMNAVVQADRGAAGSTSAMSGQHSGRSACTLANNSRPVTWITLRAIGVGLGPRCFHRRRSLPRIHISCRVTSNARCPRTSWKA